MCVDSGSTNHAQTSLAKYDLAAVTAAQPKGANAAGLRLVFRPHRVD
jgi:hypothetical protein